MADVIIEAIAISKARRRGSSIEEIVALVARHGFTEALVKEEVIHMLEDNILTKVFSH